MNFSNLPLDLSADCVLSVGTNRVPDTTDFTEDATGTSDNNIPAEIKTQTIFSFTDLEPGFYTSLPWLLLFLSELCLFLICLLAQALRWHPVSRSVFPERLPENDKLPAIDVFVFTADADREPTLHVMNTVISAMALDYPPDKLHVYLSDDGGSAVTLNGMREAWRFSKWWIPFCRRFKIQKRCPDAYFSSLVNDDDDGHSESFDEFTTEQDKLKVCFFISFVIYLLVKFYYKKQKMSLFEIVMLIFVTGRIPSVQRKHTKLDILFLLFIIFYQVIQGNPSDPNTEQEEIAMLPQLVYVSREKRPSHPHHFKAGAFNALLRVSGVISNSPYILALDCDMYCNDPTSARQAMCFHLDPKISSSLAFVQFPQRFHNVSRNDIYDSQIRSTYSLLWQGMDGLDGPVLSGTGFFLKRVSLYGRYVEEEGADPIELKKYFGPSNEFIKSLVNHKKPNVANIRDSSNSNALLQEAKFLASCTYGSETKWGQDVSKLAFLFSYKFDYVLMVDLLSQNNWIGASVLLSLAVNLDWELHQLDVKTAFLNGELEEEVYMSQPSGFEESPNSTKVVKELGYVQGQTDHTLFIKHSVEGKMSVLILYVDDIIVTGNHTEEMSMIKERLAKEFEVKNLGALRYFLGMEFARSKSGISVSQRKYTLDLLKETEMLSSKPNKTPIELGDKRRMFEGSPVDKGRYQQLVGKFIFLSHTRPDIAFAVSLVSQYMHNPCQGHLNAVYRIMRYLKQTSGKYLFFKKTNERKVEVFTDADWAGSVDDRKSTSGYCTIVWGNVVTW
ncbi:cellulose synthase A catalytic subunit 9 [UDP-forming]-like [Humulus lupulus]|uniref:cellulose synthase A catalytic subunit 9 [UDP-forming]-like n=1 Tax=Humulus lupulus TaxID=3486 RepID=UPI002B4166C1|nr:cellulose synthase A catalytic subunit 9 [UDP-forming]-like [Humulus lupulus]